ncbi:MULTISPECIES: hypothetical protein [Rhodococcus]|uniref:PspA-associated protein PspAA n=1 Tax=Rhodococcus TaxID=1827 RepID=UPI000C9B6C24|nr:MULTISPECIES: hypothetical protein [Rhodococcus]PND52782.1 hypothetical protein CQZ88_06880 [Rhodococcus sp. ENV425]WKX01813.1 hypothetical protein Q3O43_27980 [Rhodococcus aetherivorans]
MIIRILGEGQYEVAEEHLDDLNTLDERLMAAIESDDPNAFAQALQDLLVVVRRVGRPVAAEALAVSELIVPGADAELAEVRALLGDDGLIPG